MHRKAAEDNITYYILLLPEACALGISHNACLPLKFHLLPLNRFLKEFLYWQQFHMWRNKQLSLSEACIQEVYGGLHIPCPA